MEEFTLQMITTWLLRVMDIWC